MERMAEFKVKPIGFVEYGIPRADEEVKVRSRYQTESRIKILDEYADGLSGPGDYSHIIVIWWMHEAREVRLKDRWRAGMPEVGIFATRFPPRPNPIGVSVVELLGISSSTLTVRGLDAWPGSPIIDIKPYDYYDLVKTPRVSNRFLKHWNERKSQRRYDEIAPWLGP